MAFFERSVNTEYVKFVMNHKKVFLGGGGGQENIHDFLYSS